MVPRKGHILVIEDDGLLRDQLRHILQEAGYRVSTAANHDVAEQMLALHSFDLILSDNQTNRNNLDELSGCQFLWARRNRGIRTILWSKRLGFTAPDDLSVPSSCKADFFIGLDSDTAFVAQDRIPRLLENY